MKSRFGIVGSIVGPVALSFVCGCGSQADYSATDANSGVGAAPSATSGGSSSLGSSTGSGQQATGGSSTQASVGDVAGSSTLGTSASAPAATGGMNTSSSGGSSALAAGGTPANSGGTATGGMSTSATAIGTGGSFPATGGTTTIQVATGGTATGGTATGGAFATGGRTATGGNATGGLMATGGRTATGGNATGGFLATGGRSTVTTGGTKATGGTSSTPISSVATPASYKGTAWVTIDYSPFGLDEYDWTFPVIVKVGAPLTVSLSSIVDANPVYVRIEPYPLSSIATSPKYGQFLFETSAKVGPSNPPGVFTDSKILRYWNTKIANNSIEGTLTNIHTEVPVIFTNFFHLPDVVLGTPTNHRISLNSDFDASVDDGTIYVTISGMIDQPIVDPNTYKPILIQTPFYVDIEADLQ